MNFLRLLKRQRIFSVDKKRGILAVLFLVIAVGVFNFHRMNLVMLSDTTPPSQNQEALGSIFQDTELK
ncbi:MAG: hypothetical protein J1E62_01465 [Lachnospiraceae bacterium]|nr:hypothetical protein [Lachnospiraceae bacterium]